MINGFSEIGNGKWEMGNQEWEMKAGVIDWDENGMSEIRNGVYEMRISSLRRNEKWDKRNEK